jgi:hypothetical protein
LQKNGLVVINRLGHTYNIAKVLAIVFGGAVSITVIIEGNVVTTENRNIFKLAVLSYDENFYRDW